MSTNSKYILELKEIDKQFPGVHALDHISFNVTAGSVHGIIGENGAGKSTLMKILIGIQPPTSGTVIFSGEEVHFRNPAEALNKGIAMVHQELMPIRELTVAQSIFIGKEPIGPLGHIDDKRMVKETQKLFDRLKITINRSVYGKPGPSLTFTRSRCKNQQGNVDRLTRKEYHHDKRA